MIILPNQPDITLSPRGSAERTPDTYARAAAAPPADTSVGDALLSLSKIATGIDDEKANKDKELIPLYQAQLNAAMQGSTGFNQAVADGVLNSVHPRVRAYVTEGYGRQQGEEAFRKWFNSPEGSAGMPDAVLDPAAYERWKQDALAKGLAAAGTGNLWYRNGFTQAYTAAVASQGRTLDANRNALVTQNAIQRSTDNLLKAAETGAPDTTRATDPEKAAAVVQLATELGVNPLHLATIMSFETKGKFDPNLDHDVFLQPGIHPVSVAGRARGLIGFIPELWQKYGIKPNMSFNEQLQSVGAYLRDRAAIKGVELKGLDVGGLYKLVNPGYNTERFLADLNRTGHVSSGMAFLGYNPRTPRAGGDYQGTGDGSIVMANQGGIRNLPITGEVRAHILAGAQNSDVKAVVTSGGQPAAHEGGRRTGSDRHDHGNSADLEMRDAKTGRPLSINDPEDRKRISAFITASVAAGANGIGIGPGYMDKDGVTRIHVGGGSAIVWGAGGSRANAPDWAVAAHAEGMRLRAAGGMPQKATGAPTAAPAAPAATPVAPPAQTPASAAPTPSSTGSGSATPQKEDMQAELKKLEVAKAAEADAKAEALRRFETGATPLPTRTPAASGSATTPREDMGAELKKLEVAKAAEDAAKAEGIRKFETGALGIPLPPRRPADLTPTPAGAAAAAAAGAPAATEPGKPLDLPGRIIYPPINPIDVKDPAKLAWRSRFFDTQDDFRNVAGGGRIPPAVEQKLNEEAWKQAKELALSRNDPEWLDVFPAKHKTTERQTEERNIREHILKTQEHLLHQTATANKEAKRIAEEKWTNEAAVMMINGDKAGYEEHVRRAVRDGSISTAKIEQLNVMKDKLGWGGSEIVRDPVAEAATTAAIELGMMRTQAMGQSPVQFLLSYVGDPSKKAAITQKGLGELLQKAHSLSKEGDVLSSSSVQDSYKNIIVPAFNFDATVLKTQPTTARDATIWRGFQNAMLEEIQKWRRDPANAGADRPGDLWLREASQGVALKVIKLYASPAELAAMPEELGGTVKRGVNPRTTPPATTTTSPSTTAAPSAADTEEQKRQAAEKEALRRKMFGQ